MKLTLKRTSRTKTYTIGTLSIDGVRFCDTLEDTARNLTHEAKVMHQTAIPEGTYLVIVDISPRFGRELPRLLDVPHFSGILIHRGNTVDDTSGCILVGENKSKGQISNSTPYEVAITAKIKEAIRRNEQVTITIC